MRAAALAVGRVIGAHGVRGALRLRLYNEDSDTLEAGRMVELRVEGAPPRAVEVQRVAPKPGSSLCRLWLQGVGTREEADALRGAELWVDRGELPPEADDEVYLADLVGGRVREASGGRELGEVVGVTTNTVQDLLEVRFAPGQKGTWLLPVLPEFLVGFDGGFIEVDLPEGFLPEALEVED